MKILNPTAFDLQTSLPTVKSFLLQLHDDITMMVKNLDPSLQIQEDNWQHREGGGGITRALNSQSVIEKGGVNFSSVTGKALPPSATQKHPQLIGATFHAMGVSVVFHPINPFVPTAHFNVRFLLAEKTGMTPFWWFGGGFDLTPYYPFIEDCVHWHQMAHDACAPFGNQIYPRFKKAADDYFYLPHRQEPRGIGGIFFDDLNEWSFADCFSFAQSVGAHFIKAYEPIVLRRKDHAYSQHELDFQRYRRGRYVEYNLIYDRGTLFGLQFGGRIESILMSLPPQVNWVYNWQPEPGSQEAILYQDFLISRDWL